MAISIKAVLGDKTKFPDDAKFTLGGEEISFGELRRQNDESNGEIERQLQTRQSELDNKQRMQEQATATLANVLERVSQSTGLTYEQLVNGQIPENMRGTVREVTLNTRTDSGVALKDDPLYKPILDQVIAPMQNDMSLIKKTLGVSIGAYGNTHTKTAYHDFMLSDEKPEGFKAKYTDALQIATNKGYKDEYGFPDVQKALREMAGTVSQKADMERTRQEGFEAGRKQAQAEMLAQMGAPQAGTGGISFETAPETGSEKPARVKTIKEKLDEAFSDPSIAGTLFGGMVQ